MINLDKNNEPLDLSYLREMSGDSTEFIVEMIDVFKEQTPLYIAEIRQAITNKDWVKVSNCAHKIKPTFAYLGRGDAKDHMQMIETVARESSVNEAVLINACDELFSFIEVLYRQLDEARAKLLG